jgi:N-acetylmuramoyl-L-alanine amidase
MTWINRHTAHGLKRHTALSLMLAFVLTLALVWPCLAQEESAVYKRAKSDYYWLIKNKEARGVYQNWQTLVDRFARIYTTNPQGKYAAGSLYWMGRIHAGAWRQFKREVEFNESVDGFRRLIKHFPNSNLADDAQFMIAKLYEEKGERQQAYLEYLRVTVNHPRGDQVKPAKKRLDSLERVLVNQPRKQEDSKKYSAVAPSGDPSLAAVTEIRHWSTPTYTRVVLSLERPVPYKTKLLKKDPSHHKPRRLYLNFKGARLTPEIKDTVPIGDGLLKRARAGQYTKDTVRLVLDIKKLASYKVFTLDNPFRVVIDCFGPLDKPTRAKTKSKHARKVARGRAKEKPPEVGLASALALGVRRIVLDPGHGGKDPGAVWKGLYEKNLVLDICKRTAAKLRKKLGVEVLLTRNSDRFPPLEDRTAFANTHEADIFVSVHINAAASHRLNGLETYFLNLASDEESMRVAARENATTKRSISDLQVILNDLMLNSKINESNRLARALHKSLLGNLRKKYKVRDLKVKQAPFYVLIGARMPAVLCELGYITNPIEHQRLATRRYREYLADSLALGIEAYIKELRTASR